MDSNARSLSSVEAVSGDLVELFGDLVVLLGDLVVLLGDLVVLFGDFVSFVDLVDSDFRRLPRMLLFFCEVL